MFLSLTSASHKQIIRITTRLVSSFPSHPSPPRLPKEQQKIFEELQRKSTGAFSTPRSEDTTTTTTTTTTDSTSSTTTSSTESSSSSPSPSATLDAQIQASGQGDELHPHVRRGAPPEFAGDVNPSTGEVNGPKNEPLKWGPRGDYSYNGRVTDF